MGWLLAVHIGAGRYGERTASETAYNALMRDALETGRRLMTDTSNDTPITRAAHVASAVLARFERHALTNCGRGSNLTVAGAVECEASVACGRTRVVTSCAGVRGVAEPSALARTLLAQAVAPVNDDGLISGREPPLVLVGDGARAFAASNGLEIATTDEELRTYQVTDAATKQWRHWQTVEKDGDVCLDTVGAVCVDPDGNVAAALSSGGVLYKVPGRVGLAGCPRVGGDARNATVQAKSRDSKKRRGRATEAQRHGFAVACSGRGEQFLRTAFVQTLGRRLTKDDSLSIDEALRQSFEDAQDDNDGEALEGGALALRVSLPQRPSKRRRPSSGSKEDETEAEQLQRIVHLGVGFTTPCMGVGYVHDRLSEPRVQILRQPERATQCLVTHISSFCV